MHNSTRNNLGEQIKRIRDQVGSTANLVKITGISPSYLSRLMNGVVENPGVLQLSKIAEAGNVSVDQLLTGSGPGVSSISQVHSLSGDYVFSLDQKILSQLGVTEEQCLVFENQSDSMSDYQFGDLLLVNTQRKTGDGVYVVDLGSSHAVRRLIWLPGGQIEVISDNFGSHKIESDALSVIGRVIWAGVKR